MNVENERKELVSWLSLLEPDLRHVDVKAKRSEGTGVWFLNVQTFIAWSTFEGIRNYRVLLGFGAPGAGKTTLLYVLD